MILLNYTHSPKKIIAKMMVEETVNRRSKEENMKRVAQREMERNARRFITITGGEGHVKRGNLHRRHD